MELPLSNLNVYETAAFGILLLVYVVLAFFSQRETWIWMEIVTAFSFGISFLVFPDHLLGYLTTDPPNDKCLFVARLYGAMLLSAGITWYRTMETRDATVPITLMMSRVCMGSTLLMAQLFSYFSVAKAKSSVTAGKDAQTASVWSDKFLPMCVLPMALWMFGNLIHLLRSRDFNTYPQHNIRLNNLLRIDAWLMLLTGVMMLTFPRQILNILFSTTAIPKEVTMHVMRSCGAVRIGEAVVSLQAPGFLHSRDKLAVFGTRIFSTLLEAALLCAGCFLFTLININKLYYSATLLVPVFINALIGLVTDVTAIYVVPTPSKKKETFSRVSETVGDSSQSSDGNKFD
jgi:hypothetical protein